jgi:hypothetical protein
MEASGTEEWLARIWRREKRRRRWINRFRERQRVERKWTEFREIATWCAQSSTAMTARDEQHAFDLACQRFAEAVLQGEFEAGARSRVLYLDPKGFSTLTRESLTIACRATAQFDEHLTASEEAFSRPINVLTHCWVPADMARDWLQARGYRLPAYLVPFAERSARRPSAKTAGRTPSATAPARLSAVRKALAELGKPGRDVPWGEFCRRVRSDCKVSEKDPPRGYGDKSIQREVNALQGDA